MAEATDKNIECRNADSEKPQHATFLREFPAALLTALLHGNFRKGQH